GILVHARPESRLQPRGERHDSVVAVLFADLVDGGECAAPALRARLLDQAGLAFGGTQRLRVDAQQTNGFAGPVLMEQLARCSGQFRIYLRCVVQSTRASEG